MVAGRSAWAYAADPIRRRPDREDAPAVPRAFPVTKQGVRAAVYGGLPVSKVCHGATRRFNWVTARFPFSSGRILWPRRAENEAATAALVNAKAKNCVERFFQLASVASSAVGAQMHWVGSHCIV